MKRRAARYRVSVTASYVSGGERIRARAENVSRDGLFLCGGAGLAAGTELELEIEFPQGEALSCLTRVAHTLDGREAASMDRRPGVGLEIVEAPERFAEALSEYLERLSLRADVVVGVEEDEAVRLLAAAGFQVVAIAEALESSSPPLAVVVPAADVASLRAARADVPVIAMDDPSDIDRVLRDLDARL